MGKLSKSDYVGGVVAALLTITLLLSLFYPPSSKHYNPSEYLHTQDQCERAGLSILETPSSNKTKRESQKKSEKEKWCADRSDLAAQWKTADLTNIAFFAGLLGIWLVGWTLLATRQAGEVARDTARRELRAYLNKESAAFVKSVGHSSKRSRSTWELHIFLKNFGRTDASEIIVTSQWFRLANKAYVRAESAYYDKHIPDIVVTDETSEFVDKTVVCTDGELALKVSVPLMFINTGIGKSGNILNLPMQHFIALIKVYYTDIYGTRRVRRIGIVKDGYNSLKEYENTENKLT